MLAFTTRSAARVCVFSHLIPRCGPGHLAAASTFAECQVPSRHTWGNGTSLLPYNGQVASSILGGGEGETARLGEWMCLQSAVYLNISANLVRSVVYNCGDGRSHSSRRCCLDISFATGRVGAGAGAGLQLGLAVGSFGAWRICITATGDMIIWVGLQNEAVGRETS